MIILKKTYLNEYQQVILNILKKCKRYINRKKYKNPLIKMEAKNRWNTHYFNYWR